MTDLAQRMADAADGVEATLARLLPVSPGYDAPLWEAMRYASLGGGKRMRAFLVMEGAALFSVAEGCALRAAAAIEMVHAYSLVHDDLPAMDDADLRRGKPACHKAYGEAMAILAGDGLLTHAFTVLADPATHGDPAVRVELVATLAAAAGPSGMVGGQVLDLATERAEYDIGAITRLQRLKTGEMIIASAVSGAILGKAPLQARQALHAYAQELGLAFQIADDLLDVEGDAAEVGKDLRRDEALGKATFVSILGVERARDQARRLAAQASQHLEMFGERANPLRQLATYVVERRK
ncbi:MAG: polyprenyl synthetase family protein [Alphaproteobacteria bacterium]|nr:polyprenyl synthetase family protein [Alphaproteobacteria bacterium]